MRRTACLLTLVVAGSGPTALAQEMTSDRFSGLSAGLTRSDRIGDGVNTESGRAGTVGLFFGGQLRNGLMVVMEANWTRKADDQTRFDYIEIPLLIGVSAGLPGGGFLRPYTGIGFGYRFGCGSDLAPDPCETARRREWSWPSGIQLGWSLREGRFIAVDGRWSLGLSDAFTGSGAVNRSWQFRLLLGAPVGSQ